MTYARIAKFVLAASFVACSAAPEDSEGEGTTSNLDANGYYSAPLAQSRDRMKFPVTSLAIRKDIVGQATLLLRDVYANREIKIAAFGPSADAGKRLTALEAKLGSITDAEFYQEIASIFGAQRDLHTSYSMPYPYACWSVSLPVGFEAVLDPSVGSGDRAIRVRYTTPDAPSAIKVGDKLVTYDTVAAATAARELGRAALGANDAAVAARGSEPLGYRWLGNASLPTKDVANLVFERANKERYTVTLAWTATANQACINQPPTPAPQGATAGKNAMSIAVTRPSFVKGPAQGGEAPFVADSRLDFQNSALVFRALEVDGKRYAYFRLGRFSASDFSSFLNDIVTGVMSGLMSVPDAKGVIVDVRDNPGGWIKVGDILAQLLSDTPIAATQFRGRTTKAAAEVAGTGYPHGDSVAAAVAAGSAYSKPAALYPQSEIDRYLNPLMKDKPVGILTNARCYSTCDMFTARMRDARRARVWGEGNKTGAGGASVIEHANYTYREDLGFKPLPFGQWMRVAWAQTVRGDSQQGQLLENTGVIADESAITTEEWITNPRAADEKVIRRIANALGFYGTDPIR